MSDSSLYDDLYDGLYDDRHLTPTPKKLTFTPRRCQPASCEKNRLVKLLTGLQKFRKDALGAAWTRLRACCSLPW
jgi:hypothetical protein